MQEWEKRLQHAKNVRDGYVLCGNPSPNRADPPGGMITVVPRIFHGKVFWKHMQEVGCTSVDFGQCSCRNRRF